MHQLQGYFFEDLSVGMAAACTKTVTDADLVLFAGISGDTNPLHHSEAFAATTVFGERIAPGMLTASLVSAVLGTKLPGPGCVYMSQSLRFAAPVLVGDTVLSRVTVTALDPEKRRASFATECLVGERTVLEGEALIMVPSRAAARAAAAELA